MIKVDSREGEADPRLGQVGQEPGTDDGCRVL